MSRYPFVVTSPTFAPARVSTVLVATVVPCMTSVMSPGSMPACSQRRSMPFSTPTELSSGVEGTLAVWVVPAFSSTRRRSVKVPPTSTPSLSPCVSLMLPFAPFACLPPADPRPRVFRAIAGPSVPPVR